MGYMGNWLELIRVKQPKKTQRSDIGMATFKRTLNGLQEGGIYINSRAMSLKSNNLYGLGNGRNYFGSVDIKS
jgi:hypothetical protein